MGDFADAFRQRTTDDRRAPAAPRSEERARARERRHAVQLSDEEIDRLVAPEPDLASMLTKFRFR